MHWKHVFLFQPKFQYSTTKLLKMWLKDNKILKLHNTYIFLSHIYWSAMKFEHVIIICLWSESQCFRRAIKSFQASEQCHFVARDETKWRKLGVGCWLLVQLQYRHVCSHFEKFVAQDYIQTFLHLSKVKSAMNKCSQGP